MEALWTSTEHPVKKRGSGGRVQRNEGAGIDCHKLANYPKRAGGARLSQSRADATEEDHLEEGSSAWAP